MYSNVLLESAAFSKAPNTLHYADSLDDKIIDFWLVKLLHHIFIEHLVMHINQRHIHLIIFRDETLI